MIQKEFARVIDQVSKEKGIDKALVIETIEEAMKSAAKKTHGADINVEAKYDHETGEIELYKIQTVVGEVENPRPGDRPRVGPRAVRSGSQIGDELLTRRSNRPIRPHRGAGRQAEHRPEGPRARARDDLQRVQAARRHHPVRHRDALREAQHHRPAAPERRRHPAGARADSARAIPPGRPPARPDLRRQRERPRPADRAVAHQPGRSSASSSSRKFPRSTKASSRSRTSSASRAAARRSRSFPTTATSIRSAPASACAGSRVQAVVQELRGERIDIVPWTPDETEFVCRALSPAKVSRIVIDDDDHSMEVIVPDDQLSLAIGRKGQNVRLAGKLTRWKLDVHSDSEYEQAAARVAPVAAAGRRPRRPARRAAAGRRLQVGRRVGRQHGGRDRRGARCDARRGEAAASISGSHRRPSSSAARRWSPHRDRGVRGRRGVANRRSERRGGGAAADRGRAGRRLPRSVDG